MCGQGPGCMCEEGACALAGGVLAAATATAAPLVAWEKEGASAAGLHGGTPKWSAGRQQQGGGAASSGLGWTEQCSLGSAESRKGEMLATSAHCPHTGAQQCTMAAAQQGPQTASANHTSTPAVHLVCFRFCCCCLTPPGPLPSPMWFPAGERAVHQEAHPCAHRARDPQPLPRGVPAPLQGERRGAARGQGGGHPRAAHEAPAQGPPHPGLHAGERAHGDHHRHPVRHPQGAAGRLGGAGESGGPAPRAGCFGGFFRTLVFPVFFLLSAVYSLKQSLLI